MITARRIALALSILSLAACGEGQKPPSKGAGSSSAASSAPKAQGSQSSGPGASAKTDASKPAPARSKGTLHLETGRKAEAKFVKWDGAGADKKSVIALTNKAGKAAKLMQVTVFYYGKDGALMSGGQEIGVARGAFEDGKAVEEPLGLVGDSIPKDVDAVEVEVTRIEFTDDTVWYNENLDKGTRPKGGHPDEFLKARSGERVEVTVLDKTSGKVKVSLKNVGDKPTKQVTVSLFAYAQDGKNIDLLKETVQVEIKPNEAVEKELATEIKPDTDALEGTAPNVTFEGDSIWENSNLEASSRPRGG